MKTPILTETAIPGTTQAAQEEKRKLQTHFGRGDIFLYLICTLVGLDTIGAVAKNGAQGFTWLAFLGVFFFLPYGLLTAELGSAFTDEGGPYVWTRLAFGRLVGAITAVLYWVSNPIWVGGSLCITAVTAFGDFFVPLDGAAKYLFALGFIWLTVGSAIISFKHRQVAADGGRVGADRGACLFSRPRSALYAAEARGSRFHGTRLFPDLCDVHRRRAGFGLQLHRVSSCRARRGTRCRTRSGTCRRWWRGRRCGALLLYGVPILAVLLVLPPSHVTGLGGFLDAVKAVFTVYGGTVAPDGTATLTGAGKMLGRLAALAFLLALAVERRGVAHGRGPDPRRGGL